MSRRLLSLSLFLTPTRWVALIWEMVKTSVALLFALQTLLTTIVTYAQTEPNSPMVPIAQKFYTYEGRMNNQDSSLVEDFRQAGLHNDRSYVLPMIKILSNPPHIGYTYTTIHALAQMGAMEALPIIMAYSQNSNAGTSSGMNVDLCNFSIAAKARLIAEDVAKAHSDSRTAAVTKVKRLYQELGMTPSNLNEALITYYPPQQTVNNLDSHHWVSMPADLARPHPVGLYAVRELADIIYHGDYADSVSLPEVTQVNFTADYPSALKMRLAPLSPPERLSTMLRELSQKKVLTHWDNYEIQLASNEGLTASNASAKLLEKMETQPGQYKEVGFTALVRVIWGTGDSTKVALVKHLLENRLINTGNLPIADLTNGVKRGREPAY